MRPSSGLKDLNCPTMGVAFVFPDPEKGGRARSLHGILPDGCAAVRVQPVLNLKSETLMANMDG